MGKHNNSKKRKIKSSDSSLECSIMAESPTNLMPSSKNNEITEMDSLKQLVSELMTNVQEQNVELEKLRSENQKWIERTQLLEGRVIRDEKVIEDLKTTMNKSIVIGGINESTIAGSRQLRSEQPIETENKVKEFIRDKLRIDAEVLIEKCYRQGKISAGKTRNIIVHLTSGRSKRLLYSNANKLANTPYFINDVFPREVDEKRKSLYPIFKKEKASGQNARLVNDKLFINNKLYKSPNDANDVNFDNESQASGINVTHSGYISEQGNSFQGQFARINHYLKHKPALLKLYQEKGIAAATHNVWAYRVDSGRDGAYCENFSDDGEHGAGFKLLKLLREKDITYGMVMVTRWYNGVHLGPKRFDCINTAAINALNDAEVITY